MERIIFVDVWLERGEEGKLVGLSGPFGLKESEEE